MTSAGSGGQQSQEQGQAEAAPWFNTSSIAELLESFNEENLAELSIIRCLRAMDVSIP